MAYKKIERFDFTYEGEVDENGIPNGKGKKISSFDDTVCEGEFIDGELNGQGKIIYSDGTAFQGVWKNNYLILEGDCKRGFGKRIFDNGLIEEGEFVDGELNGKGKRTILNNSIYEGEFVGGFLVGQVKIIFVSGTVCEGEFKYGMFDGRVKMTLSNGTAYEGIWKNEHLVLEGDCENGFGKRISENGTIEEGEFKDGALNGQGSKTYSNGNVYKGEFANGKFVKGKKILPDGSVENV